MYRILDSETCLEAIGVVITYPSLLIVVSIEGEVYQYSYDSAIFLIDEMDGVRVLTNNCHEIIQKVPKCTKNIFAINSYQASSYLFSAHRNFMVKSIHYSFLLCCFYNLVRKFKFQDKSHRSDEYLCIIKDKLQLAVSECIEAAGFEFHADSQKALIRAAYFGKAFIAQYNPDQYIKTCRILRVLNAIRHPQIGIPLTLHQ